MNLEDPLAGILSDGSDDSFFDDDILGKKKITKKKEVTAAEKKNALFDLEDKGITSDIKKKSFSRAEDLNFKKVSVSADNTSISKIDNLKSPTPFKRTTSRESIKFQHEEVKHKQATDKLDLGKSPIKSRLGVSADKLDFLNEFGTEMKKETKPLEKGKSSQSLLDDILGGSSSKTSTKQVTRPTTATKSQEFDFDSILTKNNSNQSVTSNKNNPIKQNIKSDNPKKDQTQKGKSRGDWLGLFQDKEENIDDEDDSGMPGWLVGEDAKKKKVVEREKKMTAKPIPVNDTTKEEAIKNDNTDQIIEKETPFVSHVEQITKIVPTSNILQSSNEDITAEGAALYLQQQESQLMVALQLKAQEEKLAAMQMRQKETARVQREAAIAHHAQLDAIVQQQAAQRQQMQAIIAAHQERITQRIKALLGTTNTEIDDNVNGQEEFENNPSASKDSPHLKEKKQLLQLVQSLQENHDKEVDLMETSYRRQLAFLEVSIHQAEERMKEESDKLVRFYTEKINWLEEHHQLYKKLTEDNLNSLTERHKAENEMLGQQHLENIKILQEHHAALMENIKNAVKQEQIVIKDSAGFSSELHELVADVKESKTQYTQLVEMVQMIAENIQKDNERGLQARETQIGDMIEQLKKERENFESEKTESREMVKMLETRLRQMTTMIEEESASLKQKRMEFEFEKATFNKQTEFAKNVLKKQDEEIKMLKEDIQKEYQEKIAKIDEENTKARKDSAAVAKEKAVILSLKQELEKMKAELQAQLEEVSEERSKLSVEKQYMHMEGQRILAKTRDLDLLAKTAIEKQSQADNKYSEAESLQRKYEERIRRIQEHVISLNSREKHIAREKVALSRERLALHNERKQTESRQQCSLCKSTQNIPQYNYDTGYSYNIPETFLNAPASRDTNMNYSARNMSYPGTNVSSAMNAIEQEMAHLMGKSFSLRHSTGLLNVRGKEERRMDDRSGIEDNLQTTQLDSGGFKDYMDPKLMMLRFDVQQVISNLNHTKKEEVDNVDEGNEEN